MLLSFNMCSRGSSENFILSRFTSQINLIQDDDGIAELNPDEFFNNILRTLRDAIDGELFC